MLHVAWIRTVLPKARLALWAIALLTAFLAAIPVYADVGSTGAYQTAIPIEVPPYHGLEPNLGIVYNSNGGNGWLGVGWSLSGLSTIQRTSPGKGAPNYDNNDVFYLDGMELIPCTATTMQSPSCLYPASSHYISYTTKIESFQRIAFNPAWTGSGGWYVWTKTGTKMTYEARAYNSSVTSVFAWDLVSVEDTLGNKVTYGYWFDSSAPNWGETYIYEIGYNGTVVKFYYEIRPASDVITYANGRELLTARYRLSAIDVQTGSARVRAYALKYSGSGSTGRSLLQSVQQFGRDAIISTDATLCTGVAVRCQFGAITSGTALPAFQFQAQSGGEVGAFQSLDAVVSPWGAFFGGVPNFTNFNADTSIPELSSQRQWLSGDVDADGRADYIGIFPYKNGSGTWVFRIETALANAEGGGFFGYRFGSQETTWSRRSSIGDDYEIFTGDVNGDGKTDLLVATQYFDDNDAVFLYTAISQGDGTFRLPDRQQLPVGRFGSRRWFTGDVNGDGKSDFMLATKHSCDTGIGLLGVPECTPYAHTDLFVGLSNGDGSYDIRVQHTSWLWNSDYTPNWFVGDANYDGKSDFMRVIPACDSDCSNQKNWHGNLEVAFSNGDGTFAVSKYPTDKPFLPWNHFNDVGTYLYGIGAGVTQAGDFDGDGRSDLLFMSVAGTQEAGDDRIIMHTAFSNGDGTFRVVSYDTLTLDPRYHNQWQTEFTGAIDMPNRWLAADFNGDGATDLSIIAPGSPDPDNWPTVVSVIRLYSDKQGGYSRQPQFLTDWPYDCLNRSYRCPGRLIFSITVGDVNADGRADLMYAGSRTAGSNRFANLRVRISSNSALDTYRWQPADMNGDGLEDMVYVGYENPGVRVFTAIRQANGTFQTQSQSLMPYLINPVMGNWRVMDVGSPSGAPDGRADLVYLMYYDQGATNRGIRVYTLFSNGDGTWTVRHQNAWPGFGARDIFNWMPADVNGDGKSDLIHVYYLNPGIRIHTLLSNGDGNWTNTSEDPWSGFGAPDVRNWHVADVNGDGQSDLIQLYNLNPGLRIHTLVSEGDGTWRPGSQDPWSDYTLSNLRNWKILDVNADGLSDLVFLHFISGGVRVHTLFSAGPNVWIRKTKDTVWEAPLPNLSALRDSPNWRPGDVNGDGRTDLVHVYSLTPGVRVDTLMSFGDGTWFAKRPQEDSWSGYSETDAIQWRFTDVNADGMSDLVRVDYSNSAVIIGTLVSSAPLDLMASVQNGMGGTTTISYMPRSNWSSNYPASGCHLPLGAGFNLVSTLVTQDGRKNSLTGAESYSYTCAGWSYKERRFLSWEEVVTQRAATNNQPANSTLQIYDISDQCFARLRDVQLLSDTGAKYNRTIYAPNPVGSAPPYRCLILYRNDLFYNQASTAQNVYTYYDYDQFGNVKIIYEKGDPQSELDDRTTYFSYSTSTNAYLVGLPTEINLRAGPDSSAPNIRITIFCYDNDSTLTCSNPPTRGLLTTQKELDVTGISGIRRTEFLYDSYGNLAGVRDANGYLNSIFYDHTYHIYPENVCNALNQCEEMTWDFGIGAIKTVTDSNGQTTNFDYDPFGRLTAATFPDGGTLQRSYPNWGDPKQQRIREWLNDGSADGLWTETYVDGLSRPYRVVNEGTCRNTYEQFITYSDTSARVYQQSHWYTRAGQLSLLELLSLPPECQSHPQAITIPGPHDLIGRAEIAPYEKFEYDGAGRPIKQIHPDGSYLQWEYGMSGTTPVTLIYDELGHESASYQDAYGRIIKVREKNNGQYFNTMYKYNAADELLTVSDANGNVTTYTWDILGRNRSVTDPDMGAWIYEYDLVGNLREQTDARGFTTKFTYDPLNRVKTKTYPDGMIWTWNYDEPGHGFSKGRLTSISDPTGKLCGGISEALNYDNMGQVTSQTKCIDGHSYMMSFGYDKLGRPSSITYPDNEIVTYTYNSAGNLQSLSNYLNALTYNAAGQLTNANYANGTVAKFTYDPNREWLNETTVSSGSNLLFQGIYQRKANSLVESSTSTTHRMNLKFAYDELNRVLETTGDYQQSFSYDKLGNMMSNSAIGQYLYPVSGRTGCTVGTVGCAGPHAVWAAGDLRYQYDANGNMTHISETGGSSPRQKSVEWNFDNQPSVIEDFYGVWTNIRYDAWGDRVSRERSGDITYYFGPYFDLHITPSGQIEPTKYYFAGVTLMARRDSTGTYWYHQDMLGSTRLLTDQNGAVVQSYDYAPFGETSSTSASFSNNIQYTGHRTDAENGLIYMNARYYDPQLGRFISADSLIPSLFNPQALNRYSYVNNNPISNMDPTGHQSCSEFGSNCEEIEFEGEVIEGSSTVGIPVWEADFSNTKGEVITARQWIDIPASISTSTERYGGKNVDAVVGMGKIVNFAAQSVSTYQMVGGLRESIQSLTQLLSKLGRKSDLSVKAAEIHNALLGKSNDPNGIAHQMRTTAVVEATDAAGDTVYLVASSQGSLETVQIAAVGRAFGNSNVILVRGTGHAEVQALRAAQELGLHPVAVGASRAICPGCAGTIIRTPAIPDTPMKLPH
jgi:RHS repeat-associated protein